MLTKSKNVIKNSFPGLTNAARELRGTVNGIRYSSRPGPRFDCPICNYNGPFLSHQWGGSANYEIKHTQCPRCELYERHRLQFLVIRDLVKRFDFSRKSVLHFAPEPRLSKLLKANFQTHHTADLFEPGMDYVVDITRMPFRDASYDMIYASHVLEHVQQDDAALREIVRVLKPGGIAILPVPVVSPHTIEYGAANEFEFGHVRAPGPDYFERYRAFFDRVQVRTSANFSPRHQLYTYENRSIYPTANSPHRIGMEGEMHLDYVPICYVNK